MIPSIQTVTTDILAFIVVQVFNSQGSDVWNFIGRDQKIAPYQLVVFEVMTPKSDFLLISVGGITPKGFMNTAKFRKTSLFLEQDYEQQTNTRLWSVRINK